MMKRSKCFSVLMARLLLMTLVLSSCDILTGPSGPGGSGNANPKTLVVTMSATIFTYGASVFRIGLFPVGTTSDQASNNIGLVAGVEYSSPGWTYSGTNPVTLNLPIYNPDGNTRWIGNGTYDIYAILYGGRGHAYKLSSVNFSTDITTVQLGSVNEI